MTNSNSIHEAAENGDMEQLRHYLRQKPSLMEVKGEGGRTPLQEAVCGSQMEAVNLLLSRGADVHSKDDRGWTPLQEATYNSTPEMVQLLLAHGADVNTCDDSGRTPLHYAAEDGYADIVALLLQNGANIDAKDNAGRTAMQLALDESVITVKRSKHEVVKVLEAHSLMRTLWVPQEG